MALDAAAPAVAWDLYDMTGGDVRPEYLWPVLWAESNLDPTLPNQAGAPYYGINQIAGSYLDALGIDRADYLTWAASAQLSRVVVPFLAGVVHDVGGVGSGTRLYQANFYPKSVKTARTLGSVIVWRGSAAYRDNAGLDRPPAKGAIVVGDLARSIARGARAPSVQAAIAASYAARPSEAPPEDPVYGTDFAPLTTAAAIAGILGGLVAAGRHTR